MTENEDEFDAVADPGRQVTRGGWLTAFLIMMVIVNTLSAGSYFFRSDLLRQLNPALTEGTTLILGAGSLLNILFALLVWKWRKAGIYGFFIVAAIAVVVNFKIGMPLHLTSMGVAGPVILFLLALPRWSNFS